jgi:hypothetical protein
MSIIHWVRLIKEAETTEAELHAIDQVVALTLQ